jgi:2-methylcitrate dehydratase PrpD
MANVTERIAQYIDEMSYGQLTKEAIEQAKSCFLDWIGVTVAGAKEEVSEKIFQTVKKFGGTGQASVLGKQVKLPLPFAALINGTSSHALDYDDVYVKSAESTGYGHPSAPVIPAILAIAEWRGLSGKEFILSLVVAIQVEYAIGEGVIPEHYDHGWHNTGTIGHFGAAAGVSKLLRLKREEIVNALGMASTQAAGLRKMFGTMCKPLHAGKAAMDGLLSGLWALAGMDSSKDCLGGELGFLNVYSSNPHPERINESLFKEFHILKARFKDYPSCRSTHAVIDGMVELRKKYSLNAAHVKEIRCNVAPLSIELCNNPSPRTALEGKFSIAHCAVAALVEGPLFYSHFTDKKMADPSFSKLRPKVSLSKDPKLLTSQSRISVVLTTGEKYDIFSDIYNLEKEKTIKGRLYNKVTDILHPLIGKRKTNRLLKFIEILDDVENISDVIKCLD